jgi:hypothetical protein
MRTNDHRIATVDRSDRRRRGPLGDTGDGDTGVPATEQGISNRRGDKEADGDRGDNGDDGLAAEERDS